LALPEGIGRLTFEAFPISEKELLSRYEKTFTAAVGDVLFLGGHKNCYFPTDLKPLVPGSKVAGVAFTIKGFPLSIAEHYRRFEAADDRRAAMFEEMDENIVIVWDTSGDNDNAQYGEMMSAATMMRGAKGGVVDGGARDTDAIVEMGFPVWCRYTTPASMRSAHEILDWQIPIQMGKVPVMPGDLIFADRDGIIRIPRDMAYDTLLKAEEIQKEERGWRDMIASGLTPSEIVRRGGKF
jgi:regulator of RNase E activity RraA